MLNKLMDYSLIAFSFVVYYILFVPAGLVLRLLGVDFLMKKVDPNGSSYWIDRKI